MDKNKKRLNALFSISKTFVMLIILVGPALYFGYKGQDVEMGLAIIMGALAATFLNLDKFSEFSGGGFSAKMKEAIKEAYATIDKVKEVTEPLIALGVRELAQTGRNQGIGFGEKHEILKQLSETARSLGIQENELFKTANETFIRYHIWDLYYKTTVYYERWQHPIVNDLRNLHKFDTSDYPTKNTIQSIINKYPALPMDDELKTEIYEAIEDYEHYRLHKTPRRMLRNLYS